VPTGRSKDNDDSHSQTARFCGDPCLSFILLILFCDCGLADSAADDDSCTNNRSSRSRSSPQTLAICTTPTTKFNPSIIKKTVSAGTQYEWKIQTRREEDAEVAMSILVIPTVPMLDSLPSFQRRYKTVGISYC
jgi:hypothetical protein